MVGVQGANVWNMEYKLGENYHDIKSKAVPKRMFYIFIKESFSDNAPNTIW